MQIRHPIHSEIALATIGNPFRPEALALKMTGDIPGGIDEWCRWFARVPDDVRKQDNVARLALCVGIARLMTDDPTTYSKELRNACPTIPKESAEVAFRSVRVERKLDRIAGDTAIMNRLRFNAWAAAFGTGLEHAIGSRKLLASSPVLITGATGTGKELIANALRQSAPSVGAAWKWEAAPNDAVHLAALPPSLVQAELFGHEKGAFTGADKRKEGVLERCHAGVVFLDEVAELPAETQVALLRVLQEGNVRRLGAAKDAVAAPRIVSATHRDLQAQVDAGTFRQDLYYRLSSVIIRTPALRERREDIEVLAEREIENVVDIALRPLVKENFKKFIAQNAQYDWPGNVRELSAVVRTLALGLDLELPRHKAPNDVQTLMSDVIAGRLTMNRMEAWYAKLVRSLSTTDVEAAFRLGIHRDTLRKRLNEGADGK